MEEIWKPIDGYPNYCVSNWGNVKSLNYNRTGKEQILKPRLNNRGYLLVNLFKNGKGKNFLVHRLAAMAFLPNPNNYPQVNHKTENPLTNFIYINEDRTVNLEKSELEWCTAKYNVNFGTRNERDAEAKKGKKLSEDTKRKLSAAQKGKKMPEEAIKKLSKIVLQIDPQTNKIIKEWQSTREVHRQLGFSSGNVSKCCNGKLKTYKGFIWKFK